MLLREIRKVEQEESSFVTKPSKCKIAQQNVEKTVVENDMQKQLRE